MSILTKNTGDENRPSRQERKARRIKASAISTTDTLISGVVTSLNLIWDDEDPQSVLDELSTDAEELFELNTNTVIFLTQELTGKRDEDLAKVNEAVAKVLPHTINEDGSITID